MIQKSLKSTGKKLQARQSQTARFLVLYPFSEGGRLLGSFLALLLRQNAVKIELIWRCTILDFLSFIFYYKMVTLLFCRFWYADPAPQQNYSPQNACFFLVAVTVTMGPKLLGEAWCTARTTLYNLYEQ